MNAWFHQKVDLMRANHAAARPHAAEATPTTEYSPNAGRLFSAEAIVQVSNTLPNLIQQAD